MNNVLNTFYLLFKSDSKQAQADIIALDKKLETLRAKGKKRTDEERKETYELIKQRKEMNKEIGETVNQTEKLIESATQAAAAYISFQAIKSGIIDAQKFNRELTIQTDLWKQNANTVAAYGAAVKASGGSSQAALGWYQGIRQQNIASGLPTMDLDKLLNRIHGQVMKSPDQAQFLFQQYGITDNGMQTLLKKSDSEYYKAIETQKELTAQTAASAKASQEFGTAVDSLETAMTNLWSTIGQDVLPILTDFINTLTDAANWLGKNKAAADVFFGVMVAGATTLSLALPKLLLSFTSVGSVALTAASAVSGFAAALARILVVLGLAYEDGAAVHDVVSGRRDSLIGKGARAIAGWIDPDVKKFSAGSGGGTGNSGSAVDFFMKQGYSREQAAGIAANMLAESGGNAAARGDGGRAVGLFQWHPDRVQEIYKRTGIDVRTAGYADQLKAAAAELDYTGLGSKLRQITGAGDAGAFVSRRYERPAAELPEAMARAQRAIAIANGSPFSAQNGTSSGSSSSTTVQVGKIEIQTNSSDPQAIVRAAQQAFKTAAREAHAQYNDSVNY